FLRRHGRAGAMAGNPGAADAGAPRLSVREGLAVPDRETRGGGVMSTRRILIGGGSSGIGRALAEDLVAAGHEVILTSRDRERAERVAAEIGPGATGIALDVSEPEMIAGQLGTVGTLNGVVMVAIERDANSIKEYDIARA